eukprot:CAMPEP_0173382904 /NCGR_PEP_ID=MMETSP1356-20130122/5434_1 /TAXON_ID=77927 ORGANISM="Hemiselmis virescens, Strain PCC157" /NCGR_SAMPLE_ID=MMETSP1356 /ASSEMBLY_ACC=CAM_ASM_000847 /LENGTH=278 /DNA_ID=CAMNT_0014337497 /DNA_START=81 /DNA_END=917 /DNA_ORIENTATION=-
MPCIASAFQPGMPAVPSLRNPTAGALCMASGEEYTGRRAAISVFGGAALGALSLGGSDQASALVKGVAPPEGYGKGKEPGEKRITNMQEAREAGAKREASMFEGQESNFEKTPSGDRFRDKKVGTGAEVKMGSEVDIKYRVLRLGKRSRDGLGGEASLVMSYGYGEDDDKETDVKTVRVGETPLVLALEESIIGLKEGGVRRVSVRPERGWRKPDQTQCAGAIDIGTAIGLPGGAVTEAEGCLDTNRVPVPTTFQAKRKLGRRFDETMLLEVEVVAVR